MRSAALALAVVALTGQRSVVPDVTLSRSEVRQAIAAGRAGSVTPYPLRSVFPKSRSPAGVVFTAYVRVALAARAAFENGRSLTEHDLPVEALTPTLLIAMHDGGEPPRELSENPYEIRLLVPSQHVRERSDEGRPALAVTPALPDWMMCDQVRALRISAVGSFPRDWIEPDSQIILYRRADGPGGHRVEQGTAGIISARELADWK